ncbi:MAG: cation-translocating P-type ATPase [Promethearchaeota archaeon]
MEKEYYNLDLETIYRDLGTDPKSGLSEQDARARLERDGPNELPKPKSNFIKVYLAPLFNWLIVIYLIGALILMTAALVGMEGNMSMIAITLGIVGFNCLIAIFQQARATKKLNALRQLSAPTTVVVRDGQRVEIPSKDVVRGDVLDLGQGDRIPADARIIQAANLEVDEASLTGESDPVKKARVGDPLGKGEIPIAERKNMVFFGTYITLGAGTAVVVETGGSTEIGKISRGLEEAGTSDIPIRKKMNNFGKWLGLAVLVFWFIIFLIIGIARNDWDIVKSLNSAMDIMPINIPLLVTIVLLTGVLAMAQHGVIIRNLASVDSLGRVSVVCTDKTGTLTKSQMCVQEIWSGGEVFRVTGNGYAPDGEIIRVEGGKGVPLGDIDEDPQLGFLITAGRLNNNSSLTREEIKTDRRVVENWSVVGSPTEGALVALFQKAFKKNPEKQLEPYREVREYPFDSRIKRMSKVFDRGGTLYSFTKGASEVLLPLCTKIQMKGAESEMTQELRERVSSEVDAHALRGYRVLSLCYKQLDSLPPEEDEGRDECERDMTYLGFVTILDPPREGVKESVDECHAAGVDVVMITGDSPATARAIAEKISIIRREEDLAILGSEIQNPEYQARFSDVRVFARVSPEHKQSIVEQYQSERKVVAMTGDGVNDALALNMADAGIAMGIQGTDVAKEAADMVISDDSFNSIVHGIHQGRGIFAKIRAVVFFYICINLFEGIVQFILSPISGFPYFLDQQFYYQWVFLSLTVHTFPGLILTFDSISDDVMKEKPRDSEEILSRNTIYLMLVFGALLAVCMLITYFVVFNGVYPVFPENTNGGADFLYSDETLSLWVGTSTVGDARRIGKALTMLMVTLFFCETFLIFQIRRPNKSLFKSIKEDSTKLMYLVTGFLYAVFLLIMYVPRAQLGLARMNVNFMFMSLTAMDWLVCFAISLICIVTFEVIKFVCRIRGISF